MAKTHKGARRPGARRRGFAASLKARKGKVNNQARMLAAKCRIRLNVLEAVGAGDARVFDAFAGDGVMYRNVWKRAAFYRGCDQTWYRDGRTVYVADNRRVLRAIDLHAFNVFDLDAHGSPWEQAVIVAARRALAPGEKFGLVLTDGSSLKLRLGGFPNALRDLVRIVGAPAGGAREHDRIIDAAVAEIARRMGGAVVKRWQGSGQTSARVRYIGLVIEASGKPAQGAGRK